MTLVRRLSLPHLRKAPLRSGLVVLGIALGVATVVASRATSDALMRTFNDFVERVSDRADLVITGSQSGIPVAMLEEVVTVPGVAHAAPAIELTTSFANDGEPLLILGVDFLGDPHFVPLRSAADGTRLVDDPLTFINDPSALLISRSLAQRRQLRLGSKVAVLGAGGVRTLQVRAIVDDEGGLASFGGQVAVMFIDAVQLNFGRGTLVDRLDIALDPHVDHERTRRLLEQRFAGRARVELPGEVGQRMRSLLKPLSDGMQLSGALGLLVAIFVIYNAVSVSVIQRRTELGVLRSLGMLRLEVTALFCIEASVLAVIGIGLGFLLATQLIALTHAQTEVAISRMYGVIPAPPVITFANAAQAALAGMGVSLLGALLPAQRGARLEPVVALQRDPGRTSNGRLPSVQLALFGVSLMLAARPVAAEASVFAGYAATILNLGGAALVVPLLLLHMRRLLLWPVRSLAGVPGRLGLDCAVRNLPRSTMNVLALMVAVVLSVGTSGWLESFETSVRGWYEQVSAADLVITAGSPLADHRHVSLGADTLERLHGMPGVAELQTLRLSEQRYGNRSFRLIASDTRAYLEQAAARHKPWKVLEGRDPIGADELFEAPRIVLAENAARRLGLSAGQHMRLSTPSGPLDFEIRAVVVDYSSELGAAFIDRHFYEQSWHDPAIDVVNLYLAPGAEPSVVAQAVRSRLGQRGVFVTSTRALRGEFIRIANESFPFARALELIMLFIAIGGMISTMAASVLDRTREIGVLRAIGATRGQVVGSIMIEAGFLGLCAAGWGTFVGSTHCALLLHSVVARSSGWHLAFVFPLFRAARFCSVVVATTAAAGLAPGLRAARLATQEALSAN